MPNPRLAARYAKALLDFSIEQGMLEEIFTDMKWLDGICKSNRDFTNLLRSPIIREQAKINVINAITTGRVNAISRTFLGLLITKNREANLDEITHAFAAQYREHKNIKIVKLTTAIPVGDGVKKAILNKLKESGDFQNIELEEKVNPGLIGGFVLETGDKMIDASVAYDLKAISTQFKNNDFIYRVR
ncbi:MAG: ATP synthase F1 subunit delta [Sphingobacteriales bacterium]|jgi:F-type H+-transporting ATPase subunit delta|nr:ATP synthase F1 subunit delta [Sphingobacteriales bacterium]